jgi:protein-S-isoprenylcysteine O-methyltransferase
LVLWLQNITCFFTFYNISCPPLSTLTIWEWCTYFCSLCIFHLLEFFVTALYNPSVATSDSFLINHSIMYTTAAITSWIEFWLTHILLLTMTRAIPLRLFSFYRTMSITGLVLVIGGQWLRSCAMATASESFNHYIQIQKNDNHRLVTNGVYAYVRHPSYMGFFFWSIGTQLILGNILHTVVYTAATWQFFYRRIAYEEESLNQFFPEEYPSYVSATVSGIPFINTRISYNKNVSNRTRDQKFPKKDR